MRTVVELIKVTVRLPTFCESLKKIIVGNIYDTHTMHDKHASTHMYTHTQFSSMDAPGSNTRKSAGSLSSLDKEDKTMATHVILVPLLSADPNTVIVLMCRFCVAFSVTGAELSSNPLLLRSGVIVALFTCHLIVSAIAVHVKLTVLFSPTFTDSGGTIIPAAHD